MKDDIVALTDIVDRAKRIFEITGKISKEDFMQNTLYQDALIRSLEVIGEAANKLSDEFCAENPDIPVHEMTAIRNILIHNYSIVDLRIVWDTAINDIPLLYSRISEILR